MHRVSPPARNVVLWLLALFSGALALLGMWVILDRLPGMEAVLDDGTATPTQVYGGQSWVVVGAAVLTAGLVGLALTLAVAARAARPAVVAAEKPVDERAATEVAEADAVERAAEAGPFDEAADAAETTDAEAVPAQR